MKVKDIPYRRYTIEEGTAEFERFCRAYEAAQSADDVIAARKIMHIRSASDVLGDQVIRILDPSVFMEVLRTGRGVYDQREYLAEYKCYVEQTVVYDRESRLLVCIMRDVTDEESEREKKESISRQTIEVADKVVDKQMRIVQEIASLLGETAAETKIALSKLKESIQE